MLVPSRGADVLVPSVVVPKNPENIKGEQHFFSQCLDTLFVQRVNISA